MNKQNNSSTEILSSLSIKHKSQAIDRNTSRVICRLLMYGSDPVRIKSIVNRILRLDNNKVSELLDQVKKDFSDRHKDILAIFENHYKQVRGFISPADRNTFSEEQRLLIGAFFTMEYAIESAALFNPSIVPHPDQSTAKEGELHFIMSLRAVGEGHISSIVFRSGMINSEGELLFEPSGSFVKTPMIENPVYRKRLFHNKLIEMQACDDVARYILDRMPQKFIYDELKEQITELSENPQFTPERQISCFKHMRQLADSDYQLKFEPDHQLSERVIFPVSDESSGGLEDARFVKFDYQDGGEDVYFATYTAYDGKTIMPQIIETHDFNEFRMNPLYGNAVRNKGMALFPRKIGGRYAMLSRQDGENNSIMFSERLHHWNHSEVIQSPTEYWEMVQLGNCGSPLETPEGWLVLTHGVGPMRTYSIGAILLNLENPTKIIGRLKEPLLKPDKHTVIGYVPNVVYTCGAIIHNGHLVIPYAISDFQPAVASVEIDEVIGAMERY
ncbi:MAG: glycoside hydrolase family 130 protein [Balneolaceae bacterium]